MPLSNEIQYDYELTGYLDELESIPHIDKINSGMLVLAIFKGNAQFERLLKSYGISLRQIENILFTDESGNAISANLPVQKAKSEVATINKVETLPTAPNKMKIPTQNKPNKPTVVLNGETEKNLTNLNNLAQEGKIGKAIGCEKIYNEIFNVLAKFHRNNVILVGENGVGKSTIARGLAYLINNDDVPLQLRNKRIMELDILAIIKTCTMRPMFETKIKSIIDDAAKKGVYIFYIDDIHILLGNTTYFGESDASLLIEPIFTNKNILFIASTTPKGYNKYIANNAVLSRKITRINIDEPSEEESFTIINSIKDRYEQFHRVTYTDDIIKKTISLCKRYVSNRKLPDSAIDALDEIGAKIAISQTENEKITGLREDLNTILDEKSRLRINGTSDSYDKIDELTIRELDIKSQISILEKEDLMNGDFIEVSENNVRQTIANKAGLPIEELTDNEKLRLRNLNSDIKQIVVGQDEAVDEVCRVVKRQRVGLGHSTKPAVLFFGGYTGTGKTYLAKKLAEKVFGSEKSMVRLDMSEYSDKTSTTKLYGSSSGYIGYDNGGILTEAIKEKKHCVLLLDEIEKADADVFNVFLQIFDDGRLTDNKGNVVDFSNVIIIMTSNIGAKEINSRGKGVGYFSTSSDSLNKDLINKALKSKFKPEFLNRIDKIIYFNKLSEENLKSIIKLEINKIVEKVEKLNYTVSSDLVDKMQDVIFEKIKDETEFGARPIIRYVQSLIEDRIVDYIIEHDVEDNHNFVYEDIG
jgi:ATP-dependent Clp protease ATP-binding subunit ClpC